MSNVQEFILEVSRELEAGYRLQLTDVELLGKDITLLRNTAILLRDLAVGDYTPQLSREAFDALGGSMLIIISFLEGKLDAVCDRYNLVPVSKSTDPIEKVEGTVA